MCFKGRFRLYICLFSERLLWLDDEMYLQGLKKTIACMDEELPRSNSSINNRSDLRRILHLEGLYKKNKVSK